MINLQTLGGILAVAFLFQVLAGCLMQEIGYRRRFMNPSRAPRLERLGMWVMLLGSFGFIGVVTADW